MAKQNTVGGVHVGSVTRSIRAMTIGTLQARESKRREDWEDARDEYDQQFLVAVSARAHREPVWTPITVSFDVMFLDAPEQRKNFTPVPVFTYGMEYKSGTPAMVTVMVKEWHKSDLRGFSGATLIVGVAFPGAKKQLSFNGVVHLNFQGYGAPVFPELQEDGQG